MLKHKRSNIVKLNDFRLVGNVYSKICIKILGDTSKGNSYFEFTNHKRKK